jgi:hypothetical protein
VSGFLFDSNVLLDIATADAVWLPWAEAQFREAAAQGPILINPIIHAELAPAFATHETLEQWLAPTVFQRLPLPYAAGWRAAQAFVQYRRAGGARSLPLPEGTGISKRHSPAF